MLAIEMIASISNHCLVIQNEALPDYANHARVIVLWESTKPVGYYSPPAETGDIVNILPESNDEPLPNFGTWANSQPRLGDLAVRLFGMIGGIELGLPQHSPNEPLEFDR